MTGMHAAVARQREASRRILAIDPGPTQSAWVAYCGGTVELFGIVSNEALLLKLRGGPEWHMQPTATVDVVVIEKVQSFGMSVGQEVFETVFWSGRFAEAAQPLEVGRIGRKAIVTHLCGSAKAKDSNVRRVLMDRFGGDASIRKGGPLYKVATDIWQALAVAVAWQDGVR